MGDELAILQALQSLDLFVVCIGEGVQLANALDV
jgi:hypothetical protein